MHRHVVIAIMAGIVVAGSLYFFAGKKYKTTDQSLTSPAQQSEAPKIKLYTDAAGFAFSYPEVVSVKKVETEDESSYSNLELQSDDYEGNITIEVTSTNKTSIDALLTSNKIIKDIKKLKIAEMDARQYSTTSGTLTTQSIDQGVLFTIQGNFGDATDYWSKVYDQMLSSFKFAPPESVTNDPVNNSSEPVTDDGGVEYEGEEVVE